MYSLHLTRARHSVSICGQRTDEPTLSLSFLPQESRSHKRISLSLDPLWWPKAAAQGQGRSPLPLHTSPVLLLRASSSTLVRARGSSGEGLLGCEAGGTQIPGRLRGNPGSSEVMRALWRSLGRMAELLRGRGAQLSLGRGCVNPGTTMVAKSRSRGRKGLGLRWREEGPD